MATGRAIRHHRRMAPTVSLLAALLLSQPGVDPADSPFPGERGKTLDSVCWDTWHQRDPAKIKNAGARFLHEFVRVERDQTVAFAVYTTSKARGAFGGGRGRTELKLTAQLYPLLPDEPRVVRLELDRGNGWTEAKQAPVLYPGWHAHFRIRNWDDSQDVRYRVRHGDEAVFEGTVRKSPSAKDEIVVASLSCNSSRDRGGRDQIVANLKKQDPDLLFFAGDQSYDHREHTAAWLLWGSQFADVIRDRPTVTIPDDHDIGQANLWGEGGIVAETMAGPKGGYFFPPQYVRMVEQQQTWHLPDPVDPRPVGQGIGVYFTSLNVGGIDFAILEDRKFKTGPEGAIPPMGPRPDHINDPSYDPATIDLPHLRLLGERQLEFLADWAEDWTDAEMKACLSQTAFAGAVHLHGSADNRLLADLDCNGWPQTGRDKALRELRKCRATHICGDQHLAVVVKHGIEDFRDGPWAFTSPATVNTVYGRWWWPEDEQPGGGEAIDSPLPWTGDYRDGLGNRITMAAYANPGFTTMAEARRQAEQSGNGRAQLADGYGIVRFTKSTGETAFECWPRFADIAAENGGKFGGKGPGGQFAGWPIRFNVSENDGRVAKAFLPELKIPGNRPQVVAVVREDTGETVWVRRLDVSKPLRLPIFDADATYTVRAARDRIMPGGANQFEKTGLKPSSKLPPELNGVF